MNKTRKIVVPGEALGETKINKPGRGTYVDGDKIFSKFLGIPQKSGDYISVIPLSGVYVPKPRDKIIGIVSTIEKAGWIVDINSPWEAFLPLSEATEEFIDPRTLELSRFFDVGDAIYGEVVSVKRGDVIISMRSPGSRKLKGGVIVNITPSKIPRLIGKAGSMVNLIKDRTRTIIRVGQNGVVWLSGEEEEKAIKAIKLIDEKSHIYGLTDEISKLLSD